MEKVDLRVIPEITNAVDTRALLVQVISVFMIGMHHKRFLFTICIDYNFIYYHYNHIHF